MDPVLRALALALAVLATPAGAGADLFSPGPLAKAHQGLEGIRGCTSCHEAGERLSQARCLSCHRELQGEIDGGRGLHGRMVVGERNCEKCHREHRGVAAPLVEWGAGGRNAFDHGRTGFALEGAHGKVQCSACHDARRITDPIFRKLLSVRPNTFLGAPRACASCHFDEHRGQLEGACSTCHDVRRFKPAPGFDHQRTDFALRGKHTSVVCTKCHPGQSDAATAGAFPAPRASTFLKFDGIAHRSCSECHTDPHQGRFGEKCESCHVEDGWSVVGGAARERAFHDKTRYPLRGAHVSVACQGCHGPGPGRPARFRGLPFGTCTDCHADAHQGQMTEKRCETCHQVDGFSPARFELADHQRTSYPLTGAHAVVACKACHTSKVAAPRRTGKTRVSNARFHFEGAGDCRTCHEDPHRGQLDARVKAGGCTSCHGVASFAQLTFDHDRDASFPLEGRHEQVPCASCHQLETADGKTLVRYQPLAGTCASCHADPHAGQLAGAGGATDCGTCHGPASFTPAAKYVHGPPFTSFVLEGRHAAAPCSACHPQIEVAPGVHTARYTPLPVTCEGCHADFHRGAMKRFTK